MEHTHNNAIFGPVPSRRLGLSLGIDLLTFKTCSLDCLYCELGLTTSRTCQRGRFRDYQDVLRQVEKRLRELDRQPDSLTISGSGEPTLHLDLSKTLDGLRLISPVKRVVITNSTLMSLPEVRNDLSKADIVAPSLDAISQEVFARLNRPAPGIKVADMVKGLIAFREQYSGQIWLEILLVPGINDSPKELDKLREAARRISPDVIQLNTIVRPPALPGFAPVEAKRLAAIAASFELPTQAITSSQAQGVSDNARPEQIILHTIQMRPSTLPDLQQISRLSHEELTQLLQKLTSEGRIKTEIYDGRRYYRGLI